jgi:hypothetical protein
MSDPASALGLLSGGDIQILEFRPPPVEFMFEKEISILLYAGGPLVYLILAFGCSATLEFSIVLDSKGIREAVQEKQPIKALNSFAFRDIIDGVGKKLYPIMIHVNTAEVKQFALFPNRLAIDHDDSQSFCHSGG